MIVKEISAIWQPKPLCMVIHVIVWVIIATSLYICWASYTLLLITLHYIEAWFTCLIWDVLVIVWKIYIFHFIYKSSTLLELFSWMVSALCIWVISLKSNVSGTKFTYMNWLFLTRTSFTNRLSPTDYYWLCLINACEEHLLPSSSFVRQNNRTKFLEFALTSSF